MQLLQIARRQTDLNEAQYRTLLRNLAGAESSHHVRQREFEDIMAILEGCGFCDRFRGPMYWRQRAESRGLTATTRQVHKIGAMVPASRYSLPALCERFSHGRTKDVGLLTDREAWELIEMLKAVELREGIESEARRRPPAGRPNGPRQPEHIPCTEEEIPF